ncbi:MAG TPA: benzoate-CoA ligase family protein [Candidatus Caldiarchaeum subterraneum]|uniref:Benzoate-CoA ligase family protein n=1 Tax=Caldiarchaeum subterraneum TaxID=311458 RepID=A0A832ZXT4_CALS0|nr:benzoate-CoA ligase family protein [Candidatus Caldarchaeum subterraneum]
MVAAKGEDVEFNIPEEMNLCDILVDENLRKGRGDKIAFYYAAEREERITYRQLLEKINKIGNALKSLGVEVENRVAIVLPDMPQHVETFLGAIRIGAQPVALSTLETPQTYEYLLNDSRAKVLVTYGKLAEVIKEAKNKLRYLKHIIVVDEYSEDFLSYSDLTKDSSPNLEPEPMSKDDFCYWLYSSGTTGPPKGVIHLAHDPLYSTDTYYKHILNLNEDDTIFSTSKLFFAYGIGNTLFATLRAGASAVLFPGAPEPNKVFETIQRYKISLFFSVPVVYSRLLTEKDFEKRYNLSSLRLCVSAGEALPAAIYESWKRRTGVDILDGIGTTELTHIFISNRVGRIKPGSSGIPVPGYEVRLVDDEGREVKVGEVGKLLVKGDSIAALYWRKHEKTKRAFLGEWFFTGDSYYMDEDGFFWHVGRTDDLIKSAGAWVSPVEVEGALLKHPAVLECAVVQGYTEEGIGRPKAYVVLKSEYQPSEELEKELKENAHKNLGVGFKVPTWIVFVKELPKTATGKIQRYKLREQPKLQV